MGEFKDEFEFAGEKSVNNTWVDEKIGYDREEYYYNITHESNQYSAKMAEISLCLSMAAFNSYKVENKNYKLANQNISSMFSDRRRNCFTYFNGDYTVKPSKDSVGIGICMKELSDREALAVVVIRGGGYEDEWLSNMTIGSAGDHEGFSKASDKVILFMKEIFNKNEIQKYTKMKLWMTGYSRGSAITNITAARLNYYADKGMLGSFLRERSNLSIPKRYFYAYCFEPPYTTCEKADKAENDNIFNVVNSMDLVTKMPPRIWGFRRYGITKSVPHPGNDKIETFKTMCNAYLQYVGTDTPTAGANTFISAVNKTESYINNPTVIDVIINLLIGRAVRTRMDYVNGYQEKLKDLYDKVVHKLDLSIDDIKKEYYKHMYIYSSLLAASIALDLKSEKNDHATGKCLYTILQSIYKDITKKSLKDPALEQEIILLADLLINYIRDEKDTQNKILVATALVCIASNLESFIMGHYPELCMGWIRYLKDHRDDWEDKDIDTGSIKCPEEMNRLMELFGGVLS